MRRKTNKQMLKYKVGFQIFRFYNIIKVIKSITKNKNLGRFWCNYIWKNMKWRHLNFIINIVKNRKGK